MRRFLALASLFVCALTIARAQTVRWENSDSGDPSELQLIFQECSPEGDPQLPRIEGTTLALVGTSSQTNIVNFSMTRSTILTYRARSSHSGPISIPAFSVPTSKGAIRVPPFTGGTTRSASDADVTSRLEPGATSVWAGEIFPLTYVLDVGRRTFNQLGTNIEWNSAPLVVEDWSKFEPAENVVNGDARLAITARTRAYAKIPGPLTLNAATQLVNLQTGSVGFGLFQTPRIEQVSVASDRPGLMVRPLPAPAPAGFRGAVGQFKLASKIVPTSAAVGEPVTWTLELSGSGNWPDIAGLPQRDVSKDFNVVQPHAKRTPAEGKLFDVTLTEDVVLVPTRAGDYTLGPIDFVYFDPQTGAYKTVSAPRTTVTIAPPANAPAPPPEAAPAKTEAPPPPSLDEAKLENLKSKIPTLPSGIPRDPLSGSSVALVPMSAGALIYWLLAPVFCFFAFWLFLAIRRAQQTDPLRPRREARARLAATLGKISKAGDTDRAARLLDWQHDAALLWQIPHAAPPAAALPDPAWQTLWLESDRALYSTDAQLPTGWIARAEAALAAKPVPSFSPLRLFLPQNLLPFVAAFAFVLLVPSLLRAAETDGAPAYRRGDFAAAEKSWAAALAANPTDATARYNLSLALAQQDRWGEAAAHAAASFVQDPSNPPARWQLALSCEKAAYVPAPLAGFLPSGPTQSLAEFASPGVWQLALIASSFAVAAALALLLLNPYLRRSRVRAWSALALLGVSVLVALSAAASLHAYGTTADSRAVIAWRAGTLRSIPTESDTTQKTVPLPAGSIAVADKTFLGWTRLAFDNGQTGWVRKEDLIALWR